MVRHKVVATDLGRQYWLVRTFYKPKKHTETEELFRQILRTKYFDTIGTKSWLAMTLYKLKKYIKAKKLFRQTLEQQEKTLGTEHSDTISSKDWLASTIHTLKEYKEANAVHTRPAEVEFDTASISGRAESLQIVDSQVSNCPSELSDMTINSDVSAIPFGGVCL